MALWKALLPLDPSKVRVHSDAWAGESDRFEVLMHGQKACVRIFTARNTNGAHGVLCQKSCDFGEMLALGMKMASG